MWSVKRFSDQCDKQHHRTVIAKMYIAKMHIICILSTIGLLLVSGKCDMEPCNVKQIKWWIIDDIKHFVTSSISNFSDRLKCAYDAPNWRKTNGNKRVENRIYLLRDYPMTHDTWPYMYSAIHSSIHIYEYNEQWTCTNIIPPATNPVCVPMELIET